MRLQVTAPARLHFGLMQIDPSRPHCFGGLGLMLPQPAVRLTAAESEVFRVAAPDAEVRRRVEAASESAAAFAGLSEPPAIALSLGGVVKLHNGLGVGTQLACAAATLVATIACERDQIGCDTLQAGETTAASIWERVTRSSDAATVHQALAAASGRGKRSHVGIRGFLGGGFLFDSGASCGNGSLADRRVESVAMPAGWRTLLLIGRGGQGPSGAAEQQAFDRSGQYVRSAKLRGVPEEMRRLVDESILPSLRGGCFAEFGRSLAEYNELAGRLFDADAVADSPHGEQIRRGREVLARHGFTATGQSSWGPTLWALTDTQQSIDGTAIRQSLHDSCCDYDLHIVDESCSGARLSRLVPAAEERR